MPHVVLVPFTGFRVREPEMLEMGMRLPGLRSRAEAIGRLPALGLLTLAAHNPENWTCSYRPAGPSESELAALIDEILATSTGPGERMIAYRMIFSESAASSHSPEYSPALATRIYGGDL